MPRLYHSASSLALGNPDTGCEAAWAWQYVGGFRPKSLTWQEIVDGAVPGRGQRAPALGAAVHEVGEAYFTGKEPKWGWGTLPGRIYASGMQFLPRPAQCDMIEVEVDVGSEPSNVGAVFSPDGYRIPQHVLVVGGTRFGGFRDLGVRSEEAASHLLKGRNCSPYMLVDYKSTSSVSSYAKSADVLLHDPQVCLYSLDMMQKYGLEAVDARWLYMETRESRKAKPVDVQVERCHAERVLTALGPIARRLDLITDPLQAEMNTDRCEDYGGRPCHWSRGGPCKARRSLGAMIQSNVRKKADMTVISPAIRSTFEKTVAAKVDAIASPAVAEAPPAEAPATPQRRIGRPRKAPAIEVVAQTGVTVEARELTLPGEVPVAAVAEPIPMEQLQLFKVNTDSATDGIGGGVTLTTMSTGVAPKNVVESAIAERLAQAEAIVAALPTPPVAPDMARPETYVGKNPTALVLELADLLRTAENDVQTAWKKVDEAMAALEAARNKRDAVLTEIKETI